MMDTTSRRGPVYKRLMLASFGGKSLAGDDAQGIGDGERSRESALSHQPAMREGDHMPMGMGKTGATKAPASFQEDVKLHRPGGRGGFAFVVHTNHAVPTSTRKRTTQVPFLVVVT